MAEKGKNWSLVVLLGVAVSFWAACGRSGQADPFRVVAEKHQVSEWDLDVSSLPKMKEVPEAVTRLPSHSLPHQPGTADTFGYTIYLDESARHYWILVTGGFAGVRDLYGPGRY